MLYYGLSTKSIQSRFRLLRFSILTNILNVHIMTIIYSYDTLRRVVNIG